MSLWFRRALLAAVLILALLPLVELADHWETYGSDPEFVTVITVAGICLGFLLFRREIGIALRRLLIRNAPVRRTFQIFGPSPRLVPDSLPPIRAPIRI